MSKSKRIWVCVKGRHCCQRKSRKVLEALQQEVSKQQVQDRVEALGSGCLGMCGKGPNALVIIGRSRTGYSHLRPSDAEELITNYANGDQPVEGLKSKKKK